MMATNLVFLHKYDVLKTYPSRLKRALHILFDNLIITVKNALGHLQDAFMLQVHLQTSGGLVFGWSFCGLMNMTC